MARTRCRNVLFALHAALAMGATAAASGCTGHDPYRPGEAIGVFHVAAKLVSSTCGATPNPWEFDVRLRHDQATLYWVQGGAPISGTVDSAARAVLKSSDVRTVRAADEKTKTAACTISRDDVLEVTLAPAPPPSVDLRGATSFKGALSYRFTPTEGSSCEDQLAESGGDFPALPCAVSYELEAARTGDSP